MNFVCGDIIRMSKICNQDQWTLQFPAGTTVSTLYRCQHSLYSKAHRDRANTDKSHIYCIEFPRWQNLFLLVLKYLWQTYDVPVSIKIYYIFFLYKYTTQQIYIFFFFLLFRWVTFVVFWLVVRPFISLGQWQFFKAIWLSASRRRELTKQKKKCIHITTIFFYNHKEVLSNNWLMLNCESFAVG